MTGEFFGFHLEDDDILNMSRDHFYGEDFERGLGLMKDWIAKYKGVEAGDDWVSYLARDGGILQLTRFQLIKKEIEGWSLRLGDELDTNVVILGRKNRKGLLQVDVTEGTKCRCHLEGVGAIETVAVPGTSRVDVNFVVTNERTMLVIEEKASEPDGTQTPKNWYVFSSPPVMTR